MKGRIVIIVILFLMAVALLAVAFVFYYQGEKLPLVNKVITLPFVEESADVTIKTALNNIKNVSTASYNLKSQTRWVAYGSPFELDTTILFDGRFDDKPRGKLKINNDIEIQSLTFLTTLEASLAEDKIYFQMTEIPALPFLDLQKIKDKWYESGWDIVNFGNFNQIYDSLPNYFSYDQRLPDEVIDGQLSYHYLISMDASKFNDFYNLLPEGNATKDIFQKTNYDKIEMEIWISKNNMYLMKAETDFTNELLDIQLSLNITNYNEPISLEKPEKGADLLTLTKDIFGKTNLLEVTVFSYLVGIEDNYFIEDKDEDKLYLVWEDMFGTDDNKTDTDNDGFNDLDEIKNGYNPNGPGKLFE